MKQIKNLSQDTRDSFIKKASGLNFFGKKLDTKRLECAEHIIKESDLVGKIEARDLCDWLESNRPAKAEKAKAEKSQVEIVPTFGGTSEDRDALLPVLPYGRYIITSGQNNTLPHKSLKTMEKMAEVLEATLLVMPIKYTTTLESLERKTPSFDDSIKPYLVDGDQWIGARGLVRLATNANILPTAKQPINTAEALNTGESLTVVASPKKQLKTLTRMKEGTPHRWAYTTGSATLRHYTDTRAGAEGEQSHTFGGLYICVTSTGVMHQEFISDESGVIYFRDYKFSPDSEPVSVPNVPAIVLGDLHCEKMCPDSLERALHQIESYEPEQVILHDSLDFMSRNHHNRQSGRFLYQMGSRTVLDDLNVTVKIINQIAELTPQVFIVCSNHDLALDRWLDCPHYNADQDPLNAKTYYFLKHAILDYIDAGNDDLVMMELAIKKLVSKLAEPLADNVVFGRLDQAHVIAGFECGQHGHLGSGGARGSQRAFKKYQMPWISGHTHCPARDGQVLTVGVTGSLEMGYNLGGTAWDRANAIVYPNGTAVLAPTYLIGEIQF